MQIESVPPQRHLPPLVKLALELGPLDQVCVLMNRQLDEIERRPSTVLWYKASPTIRFIGLPGSRLALARYVDGAAASAGQALSALRVLAALTDGWLELWAGDHAAAEPLLQRAADDRQWAGFVAGTGLLLDAAPLRAVLGMTISHGASRGAFAVGSVELAIDAVAGILLAGIRRLHGNPTAAGIYILDLSAIMLQALGMPPDTARRTAEAAVRRIGGGDPA